MKHRIITTCLLLLPLFCPGKAERTPSSALVFTENKGQVADRHGKPRTDIDVALKSGGISVFAGSGVLHYQFYLPLDNKSTLDGHETDHGPIRLATYRLDVELVGANKNIAPELQDRQEYYERYYTPQFDEQGGLAHSYGRVLYKNIYPGIDWLLYIKDNKLEHEFIVNEGADARQIQIKYTGASSLAVNTDGSFTATTPMGAITEAAPYCYTQDKQQVQAAYRLNDNILSFDISPYKGKLVIDPSVVWGTFFYGSTATVGATQVKCAAPNEIYMCGSAEYSEGLGTTGVHQDTLNGTGDAYLVKFDSAGNRLWCTYYGGSNGDAVGGITSDGAGNVYMCGWTRSNDAIATTGSYQPVYGDTTDAYLVKFTPAGARIWATYYGGSHYETGRSVSTYGDAVYMSGLTYLSTGLSSPNGFQQVNNGYDAFLVKFDTAGNRLWATYYGGSDGSEDGIVHADGQGNVYMAGGTASTTDIATPGSHQAAKEPGQDGYIVKFDGDGNRLWGTYYGGEFDETIRSIVTDDAGNIYINGYTGSANVNFPASTYNIATPGSLQPLPGGKMDVFIAKFTPSGTRLWGTYYGGAGMDISTLSIVETDNTGNVRFYVGGNTDTLLIPLISPSILQPLYGGGIYDAFLLKLDGNGNQLWASYYGGTEADGIGSISADGLGNIYFCGGSKSDNNITTPGSFMPNNTPGGSAPFLVRVYDTAYPVSVILKEAAGNNLSIYPNPTSGRFNIVSGYTGNAELYGIDGRMLSQYSIKKGITNITLPGYFTPGIYFVKCRLVTGEIVTERILYRQ